MRWLLSSLACSEPESTAPGEEPLVVPDDPAAWGGPVGVRTATTADGLTLEIWYPALPSDAPVEVVDFDAFVPTSVTDRVGPVDLLPIETQTVRDAEPRATGAPWPVVVFSHGFGGTRLQSVGLTSHLASRGLVVVSADHAGRTMTDLLPCLFSPPAEGCTLDFLDDPGPDDVADLVDWLSDAPAWLSPLVDLERMGIVGHSAGAGTTVTVGNADDRFDVLVPMAGGGAVMRDVPTLRMAGTCDGIVTAEGTAEAFAAGPPSESYLELLGAGHLAFSDLCALDLGGVAEDVLAGRDDLNGVLYDSLVTLATDGCPGAVPASELPSCASGAFLDLATSDALVRAFATDALGAALGQGGGSLDPDAGPDARLTP